MPQSQLKPAKAKTAIEALITGGAAILALVLLNVVSCNSRVRLDLTESRIYSLSDSSIQMVRALPEKITVKAYFGNVPNEQLERQNYVDMLLAEYADQSKGKLTYERIDPWGNTQLQEELKKDGIEKIRLQSIREDRRQEVPMYFHVVFQHLDKKEVWSPSASFSLEGLEYDFSMRIRRLGYGKKKLGITVGYGEPEQAQVMSMEGQELIPGMPFGLGDIYEVSQVNWQTQPESIDGVDLLVVNGPTEPVSEKSRWHLDQFLMAGKPVLLLVGGMKWQAGGNQQMPPELLAEQPYLGLPADHGLGELLAAYGLEVEPVTLLDARNSGYLLIPPGNPRGMIARGLAPIVESLQKGPKEILAGVDGMPYPFGASIRLVGPLQGGKVEGGSVVPLLRTLPTSYSRKDVIAITRESKLGPTPESPKGPFLAAVAVDAKLASAFAGKPLPAGVNLAGAEGEPPREPLAESPAHTRLILVGGAGFAEDVTLLSVRAHGDIRYANGFVALHQMVDWLAEDTTLAAVRAKKVIRQLSALGDRERLFVKVGNIAGPPLLLVVIGVVAWRVRERRRRTIKL